MKGVQGIVAALFVALGLSLFPGCRIRPEITVVEVKNGDPDGQAYPFLYEDLGHPRLERLREGEGLEEIIEGERSELRQVVSLREWVRGQWDRRDREGEGEPYCDALTILERIRSGSLPGGLCSEYSAVFLQVCLAVGHQARLVSLRSERGDGHRTVEVWSNENDKWVVMDPYYDVHYEREGTPLNALELHQALTEGGSAGIVAVKGRYWEDEGSLEDLLSLYHDLAVIMRNNHLSLRDASINRLTLGLRDRYTDGRPSYAKWITDREEDLYWKVNQSKITLPRQDPGRGIVAVVLKSNTPGLARLERKTADGEWVGTPGAFEWTLHPGENFLSVRARNLRGVTGPPATVKARYSPASFPLNLFSRRRG